jgi:hypothetical protein
VSPLTSGDDIVTDSWADTASALDLALPHVEPAPGGVAVPSADASQAVAAVCPGHIDESGLRELTRHLREIAHRPAPAPERQPASTSALDALGTVPSGRKSA